MPAHRRRDYAPRTGRPHPGRPARAHSAEGSTRASGAPIGNHAMGRLMAGSAPDRLPTAFRQQMEAAFDTDLSGVRVRASSAPGRIDARATTRGDQIEIAPEHLDYTTTKGRALVAHELVHTMQHAAGRVRPEAQLDGVWLNRDPRLERQAHDTGERIARGGRADASLRGHRPRAGSVVQRDIDPARERKIKAIEAGVFFNGFEDTGLEGTTSTYKIGLGVYIDHALYPQMVEARGDFIPERKRREGLKKRELDADKSLSATERKRRLAAFKTTAKAEEKVLAARQVLGDGASTADVEKLAGASTGHTWVVFERHGEGKRLGQYTFGFSTLPGTLGGKDGAAGKKVGIVKNPDPYAKPEKGMVDYHEVTAKRYKDALKKAVAIRANPPKYSLMGDNCTTFAKKVLEAGSVTFPAAGYPVGLGGMGRVYAPNQVHDELTKRLAPIELSE